MTPVLILGAGPSASLLALSLVRQGLSAVLIGRPRQRSATEGLSQRVVEALKQFGGSSALSLLGPRWLRVSAWNGTETEMNGEFVVDRVAFDKALLGDVRAAGATVREGLVRGVERMGEGAWRVHWEDSCGRVRSIDASLIAECRGRTAPKTAPDECVEGILVSLGRTFAGATVQPHTTFVESFPLGWAWGAVDSSGHAHIQTVILPEAVSRHGGDPESTHTACLDHLYRLKRRFGSKLEPVGPVLARGIQPTLRGGIATGDFLRVGDSAYSCDPLSGHGVFEAASGALAAAPVINTLLNRSAAAALATRYFKGRARTVFASRVEAARLHYRSETRWPDAAFWRTTGASVQESARTPVFRAPAFVMCPVVEDGFIVERRAVVSEEYPRGVRFIDGVDLGRLDDLVRAVPSVDPTNFCGQLNARPESVRRALQWLQARQLASCAGY
ncbi:hypothetical protein ebA2217 [Aromatoleum aromaticum EbN1]|uniref:FAD-binding domain-containing protein n=1 Tax=Aromatoleum aromaticum (strain DSM 19018 / LMG 30748 / EbN1) TaxID=76114 RepID=Q5P5R3_AROAE|nr:FAD-dependent monooxygenase [Aromatoleum aromaticum]CAI07349.1 hypothetical protein ebA2217 [Aromatoleum aromaticum EbN1]